MTDEPTHRRPMADGAVVPPSVATSESIDFATAWRSLVDDERNRWSDPEVERAFWEAHAADYEERFVGEPEGLSVLDDVVVETDSVLEIGPGTGRYTRELARRADRVTAVEPAPAMVHELEATLDTAGVDDSVEIVTEPWPDTNVDSHDVVVAAWSLYRQPDVEACLDRILETVRRGFVLIDSPGCLPPHRRLAVEHGDEPATPPPRHAVYCGLLADRGVYPDVQIETKARERRAGSRDGLLDELLGDAVEEPERFADALDPWVEADESGWRYRYELPAAIVSWEREAGGKADVTTTGRAEVSR